MITKARYGRRQVPLGQASPYVDRKSRFELFIDARKVVRPTQNLNARCFDVLGVIKSRSVRIMCWCSTEKFHLLHLVLLLIWSRFLLHYRQSICTSPPLQLFKRPISSFSEISSSVHISSKQCVPSRYPAKCFSTPSSSRTTSSL